LWATAYNLSDTFIGMLGAFSANAISAGLGALVGGRLCDLFGRKKIYQYDMLFYGAGTLLVGFSGWTLRCCRGFYLLRPPGGCGHPCFLVADRRDGPIRRAWQTQRSRAGTLVSRPCGCAGHVSGSRTARHTGRPHSVCPSCNRCGGVDSAAVADEGIVALGGGPRQTRKRHRR